MTVIRDRLLDCLIDLCILFDRRWRWRVVDRIFLWAWARRQRDAVLLYDATTRKWYRCE